MEKTIINIKERISDKLAIEDAVLLRDGLEDDVINKKIVLDFKGVKFIPNNFFSTLLVPLQDVIGYKVLFKNLEIINLNEEEKEKFDRVYYGTNFEEE